ncbi:hypothetical protein GNP94_12040 [Paenibacillus campinasensis]|uniref:DUF2802 domain-containing protein n=1 Tax=Paenibacillus campinasensis TaxID=66347 RepID=A0ABW9T1Z5_9BACL|nr:hypothetical protein [Paenibacillus campinasensis]MUG66732.1 hypothetical protein [Paenibacillus campinasensis]
MYPWIYIVLLGVAALLYAWLLPKRQDGSGAEQGIVKEVESTLETYMLEIQNENEQLVELVGQMKEDHKVKLLSQQEQIKELRASMIDMERRLSESEARLQTAEAAVSAAAANYRALEEERGAVEGPEVLEEETSPPPVPSIKQRYAELFDLYDQGKSIDSIAKSLGLQRGEVQVIIQLAKQEESA